MVREFPRALLRLNVNEFIHFRKALNPPKAGRCAVNPIRICIGSLLIVNEFIHYNPQRTFGRQVQMNELLNMAGQTILVSGVLLCGWHSISQQHTTVQSEVALINSPQNCAQVRRFKTIDDKDLASVPSVEDYLFHTNPAVLLQRHKNAE